MKLAFIGGNGHRYLAPLIAETSTHGITQIAVANDGLDADRAQATLKMLTDRSAGRIDCQWFDDHQNMLDTFKPDVVNIGVRYGHNGSFIAQCLQRDIPTCSDKPVAATWEQYNTLCKLTSENPSKRVLVSEFPMRRTPCFAAARDAIKQGLIGEVILASGQKSYRFGERPEWYGSRADYGGTILWVASHAIDYLHYVTGLRYTSVSGVQGNVSRKNYREMEEYTINTFTLENGSAAVIHADLARAANAPTHGDDRLRIVGSLGQLEVRDETCTLITKDHGPQDITSRAKTVFTSLEMFQSLTGEKPSDAYNTRQSLRMARVLLTARDATDQGRTLAVEMD